MESKKRSGWSFVVSYGVYGGFYIHWRYTKRICLGWVAITVIPDDIDNILNQTPNAK